MYTGSKTVLDLLLNVEKTKQSNNKNTISNNCFYKYPYKQSKNQFWVSFIYLFRIKD